MHEFDRPNAQEEEEDMVKTGACDRLAVTRAWQSWLLVVIALSSLHLGHAFAPAMGRVYATTSKDALLTRCAVGKRPGEAELGTVRSQTEFQDLTKNRRLGRAAAPQQAATPDWAEIEALAGVEPPAPAPVLTLYRDNNGWCPFCERVWVALLVKGIPFEEKTLSLQKKPEWYLDKVPTGLVPAIEFLDSEEVVWESKDILLRLESDSRFRGYQSLLPEGEEERATELLGECETITAKMAGILYSSNATADDVASKTRGFEEAMDTLDARLGESSSPFFLASGFSIVDAMMVPLLERFAVQLPLKTGLAVRDAARWPALDRWFVAMQSEVLPYRDRVRGDDYSWAAAFVTILEMFKSSQGLNGIDPITAAQACARTILEEQMAASPAAMPRAPRLAAARKLIENRDAIVADATAAAAVTQTTCRTCPSCSLSLSSSLSLTPAGAYAYTYVPANTYTDDADEPAAHQRTQSASCRPCTAPRCGNAPLRRRRRLRGAPGGMLDFVAEACHVQCLDCGCV